MAGGTGDHNFGSGAAFSLGVEEELFLVDPESGTQQNGSARILEHLSPVQGSIKAELHACQLELITDVCTTTGEAVRALGALRRAVTATGGGLLGSGTHPQADEGDAEITDKKRYERIHDLLGDAAVTPACGLHVHVGMPDAESAVRTFNGLRRHLPLIEALAANSPFRHGRDTGLASAREVTMRAWPRSGVPRALRDFEDFCDLAGLLSRAADVPDYTWFWWKLRPHPRLGTVEVRSLDAQTTLEDLAALVALVHCLARHAATAKPELDPAAEVIDEGIFQAARFGVNARLPDADGTLRPVAELLKQALADARQHSAELDCAAELETLEAILRRDGGAGRQRAIHAIAGVPGLTRELTWLTSEPIGPGDP
jgi:carboxylate-amine ligase